MPLNRAIETIRFFALRPPPSDTWIPCGNPHPLNQEGLPRVAAGIPAVVIGHS